MNGEPFGITEARIAAVAARMPGYPAQLVTLMRLTVHLHKRMQDRYNAALKPFGLNYVTYNALMMVYGGDEQRLRVSQLVAASGEKPANITRICDELVGKRLLRRAPDTVDRRAVVLALTAAGTRLIEQVLPQMWQLLDGFYAPFGARERKTLEGLLRAQLAALETLP